MTARIEGGSERQLHGDEELLAIDTPVGRRRSLTVPVWCEESTTTTVGTGTREGEREMIWVEDLGGSAAEKDSHG